MADTTANIIIKAEIANAKAGIQQLKQAVADGNKTVSQAANEMRAYEKTIKDANKVAGQGASVFEGMFKQFTAGALAAQGVGMAIAAATDFLKNSFKAALEEEKQWNRMSGAITAAGRNVGKQLPQFQAMTDQLEMMSGVADKDISASFAKMTRAMIPMNKQYDMMKTALNISIDKEIDLGSVTELLIKAIAGKDMALEKLAATYGITTTKADNYYTIIDKIAKLSSGALTSAMEGNAGAVAEANIVYDRFLEDIGKGFTTAVGQTIIAIRHQNISAELLKSFNAGELDKEFDKFGDNAQARLDAINSHFKTVAATAADWGSNGAIFDPLLMSLARLQNEAKRTVSQERATSLAPGILAESRSLNILADRYDVLTSKTSLTVAEKEELKKVISDINGIMPTAINNWDAEQNAIGVNTEFLRKNTAARNVGAKLDLKKLFEGTPELVTQLDSLQTAYNKLLDSSPENVKEAVNALDTLTAPGAHAVEVSVSALPADTAAVRKSFNDLVNLNTEMKTVQIHLQEVIKQTTNIFPDLTVPEQFAEAISLVGLRIASTALDAQKAAAANKKLEDSIKAIPVMQSLGMTEYPLIDQYKAGADALKEYTKEMNQARLDSYNETNTSIAEADKFLRDLEISYMEEGRAKELAIQQASYNDTLRYYQDLVSAGKINIDQFIDIKESLDKGVDKALVDAGKTGKASGEEIATAFMNAASSVRSLIDATKTSSGGLAAWLRFAGSIVGIMSGLGAFGKNAAGENKGGIFGGILGGLGSILFDDPDNDSMLRREVARITRFSLEGAERGRREYGNQNASVSNSNSVNMGDTIIQVIGGSGEDVVKQIDKYMTTIFPQRVKDGSIKSTTTETWRGR